MGGVNGWVETIGSGLLFGASVLVPIGGCGVFVGALPDVEGATAGFGKSCGGTLAVAVELLVAEPAGGGVLGVRANARMPKVTTAAVPATMATDGPPFRGEEGSADGLLISLINRTEETKPTGELPDEVPPVTGVGPLPEAAIELSKLYRVAPLGYPFATLGDAAGGSTASRLPRPRDTASAIARVTVSLAAWHAAGTESPSARRAVSAAE